MSSWMGDLDAAADNRVLDTEYITGSIAEMVDASMAWVERVTPNGIVEDPSTGAVRDSPTYPPVVVRELIANSAIHRDLSAAALNQPVALRVEQGAGLLIANSGGLYGMSVEGLGKAPASLRNARLTKTLQFCPRPAWRSGCGASGHRHPRSASRFGHAEHAPAAIR
ncbi:MAG: hypothetical protein LBJ02_04375 [Bifidobacteriaceae bacterium]|nr:hypothetical protein [Bifidobacteriaceae bacterium]